MRIQVTVRSNSKADLLTKIGRDEYRASIRASGTQKEISDALIQVVASHFSVPRSWVLIVAGRTGGSRKVLEITGVSS